MLIVMPEWITDLRLEMNLSERGFKKHFKNALKLASIFWHEKFAKDHFQHYAYFKYSDKYTLTKAKKFPMRPLFRTGALERKILKKKTVGELRGTSKGVTLKMHYGRPPKYTEDMIEKTIRAYMKKHRVDYKTAQKKIYSTAGYNPRVKRIFQQYISAVNEKEKMEIADFIRLAMKSILAQRGGKKKRKV